MGSSTEDDDFSVFVIASDLGIDGRPFLNPSDREKNPDDPSEIWHDCPSYFADEDFSDLETRDFFRLQGYDRNGNRIVRIIGKFFPGNLFLDCFFDDC